MIQWSWSHYIMIDEISHMEIEPVDDKHGPLAMTLTFGPPWKEQHVVLLFSRDSLCFRWARGLHWLLNWRADVAAIPRALRHLVLDRFRLVAGSATRISIEQLHILLHDHFNFDPTKDEWKSWSKISSTLIAAASSSASLTSSSYSHSTSRRETLPTSTSSVATTVSHSESGPISALLARTRGAAALHAGQPPFDESTPVMRLFDAIRSNSTKVKRAVKTTDSQWKQVRSKTKAVTALSTGRATARQQRPLSDESSIEGIDEIMPAVATLDVERSPRCSTPSQPPASRSQYGRADVLLHCHISQHVLRGSAEVFGTSSYKMWEGSSMGCRCMRRSMCGTTCPCWTAMNLL